MFNVMNKLMPKAPAQKGKIVKFPTPSKITSNIKAKTLSTSGKNRTKVSIKKTKFQK